MKFGLFTHIPWPEGANPAQVIEEATEQVQFGEEVGSIAPGLPSIISPDTASDPPLWYWPAASPPAPRQSGWALRYWYRPCTIRSSWPKIRRPWT